jgi:hypothetical protein
MSNIRRLTGHAGFGFCATAALLGVGVARAAPPVALVEDVDARVPGVAMMDYLEQGRRLELGSGEWIEIDYFSSCVHERIVGGVVRVGTERSEVSEGTVERHPVQCDSGKVTLTDSQAERAAGFVQRGGAELKNRIHAMEKNQLILHGASPLIVGDGKNDIVIARFGDSHDRETLPLASSGGRPFYDYASHGRSLESGAVYVATSGDRQVVFRIDRQAAPGATPKLGRLIAFPPAP